MTKLLILDTMNLAFRAYYGHTGLATHTGQPTSVTYGVASTINKLIEEYQPEYMVAAGDAKGKTFRHDLYPDYKGNRGEKPDDFLVQLPVLKRLLAAWGIPLVEVNGYEADDVIGSLATKFSGDYYEEVYAMIVSGDKDFMQLVNQDISLIRVTNQGFVRCDEKGVAEKFGVLPAQVVDCLALMGDASDNVPGVRGIGEKTAAKLIKSLGNLDSIYTNLGAIAPKLGDKLHKSKDLAYLSKKLVTIVTDISVDITLEDCRVKHNPPELLEIFKELEFHSLIKG